MKSRSVYFVLLASALFCDLSGLFAQNTSGWLQFGDYPVKIYHRRTTVPTGFRKDADGIWYDEGGKPALSPQVNFAGEYFLAAHSCGTCCSYYTLSDLRTGSQVEAVRMFDAGEPSPRTRDGHEYVAVLFSRPGSKLLIVQYQLDPCGPEDHNLCRQRYFIFEHGKFRAVSKALSHCTNEGDERD